MIKLFTEAGALWMSLLTIEFIGLFLAAWKAPGWVKEIGLLALITGVVSSMIGFYQLSSVIHMMGEGGIAQALVFGGLRAASITLIYGCIIYGASLVIRIVQKPKLL